MQKQVIRQKNRLSVRIASKYYNDTNKVINIRMLVIHSANVKEDTLQNTLDFGAVKLTVESIILKDMDTLGILMI